MPASAWLFCFGPAPSRLPVRAATLLAGPRGTSHATGRAVEFLVVNQGAHAAVIKDQADASFPLGFGAERGPGISGEKTPHAIGEARDGGGKVCEQLKGVRFVAGFLQQLSAGRLFGSLAWFNVPGRQFEGDGGHCGPELADQQDSVLPGDSDDDDEVFALDDIVGLAAAGRLFGKNLEPRRGENALPVSLRLVHNTGVTRRIGRGSVRQTTGPAARIRACRCRGMGRRPRIP